VGRTTVDVRLIARMRLFQRGVEIVNKVISSTDPSFRPEPSDAATARQEQPCLHVYDIPGDDEQFNYLDMDGAIATMGAMHIIVVLFNDSIDSVLRYVRLAKAMGKTVVVARTQVDNRDNDDECDIDEQIKRDCKDLTTRIGAGLLQPDEKRVFGVSARNQLAAVAKPATPVELFDWSVFVTSLRRSAIALYSKYGLGSGPRFTVTLMHAAEDQAAAVALGRALQQRGYTVFGVEGPSDAALAITAGVDNSSVVIACIGPAFIAKVGAGQPCNDECVPVFRYCVTQNKAVLPLAIDAAGMSGALPPALSAGLGGRVAINGVGGSVDALVAAMAQMGVGAG
jgi:hypothetical protein